MSDKYLVLNNPGQVIEVSQTEAAELGAFEETAISEEDALEAIELEAAESEEKAD